MSDTAQPTDQQPVEYEAWEQNPDWIHLVTEEVNRYGVLPREAKEVLAAYGQRREKGISHAAALKAVKAVKE